MGIATDYLGCDDRIYVMAGGGRALDPIGFTVIASGDVSNLYFTCAGPLKCPIGAIYASLGQGPGFSIRPHCRAL